MPVYFGSSSNQLEFHNKFRSKMRRPTLFYVPLSPPARAALITSKEVGVDVEAKIVDMFSLEHKSDKFKRINPIGKVPALVDGDVYVWDSHCISIYLVEKYAQDDILYPKDIVMRTKVNQILFFEATVLFQGFMDMAGPVYRRVTREFTQDSINNIISAYELLEGFFRDDHKYLCGNNVTIGDISVWCTMLSLRYFVPVDDHKFPKINKWLKLMKIRPTYQLNQNGAAQHYGFLTSLMEGKPFVPPPMTS